MKTIETGGLGGIRPLPGNTDEWYYGMSYPQGDLYEAEELFRLGRVIKGRKLCLVHYPDGEVFFPLPETEGHYCESPVYYENSIYILDVDFPGELIRIIRFCCKDHGLSTHAELPLSIVKDCYNLQLHITPLTLSRQCGNEFEIVWPERTSFFMDHHDSFFLREEDKLFFSRWHEEGEGASYKYWEETVVKNLAGDVLEILPGDVMQMPNGAFWHLN